MLNIDREKGEAIVFALPDGEFIRILLKNKSGRKVYFAIDAPANINILRDEFIQQGEDDGTISDN